MATQTHTENAQPAASARVRLPSSLWLVPLIGAPFALAVALLYLYATRFPVRFADEQHIWGEFGDFLGGVLNPVIAWVTLIVIAITLRYTVKAIHVSIDAVDTARRQVELAQQQFDHEINQQRNRRNSEQQAQREQRTFQLHQVWISPEMWNVRSKTASLLQNCLSSTKDRPFYLGTYRNSEDEEKRKLYNDIGSVSHFIADARSLLDANLLDKRLFLRLFASAFSYWLDLYQQIDYRSSADDESAEAVQANQWYHKEIQPLATTLHENLVARTVAEHMNLPGPQA